MTARPVRHNAQVPDRNGKIFYTSITSLSHISKVTGYETVYGEIDVIKSEKGKAQSRRNRRPGQEILWKHRVSAIMMEKETGAYAH